MCPAALHHQSAAADAGAMQVIDPEVREEEWQAWLETLTPEEQVAVFVRPLCHLLPIFLSPSLPTPFVAWHCGQF